MVREKYVLTAFVLFILGWSLSLHRIYAGKTKSAIIQIIMCWFSLSGGSVSLFTEYYTISGFFGIIFVLLVIWYIVDLFLIASQRIFN
ncbi:MAG: hypothetical protein LBH40_05040 [Alphaproteobacteria bacterium]|jgi:TM2 domain-containing membrane protein YozV|nr:hypothetical protein [Alphaproteobacteria bacterium]